MFRVLSCIKLPPLGVDKEYDPINYVSPAIEM